MTTNEITASEFDIDTDRGASTLERLLAVKDQIKALESEKGALEQALRMELTSDPTPIVDLEHGIAATLTERRKPASIDLSTLAKDDERAGEYLVEAARAGVLTASLTPLRALRGRSEWADALLHREMPMGVDYVLRIEEVGRA